MVRMSGLKINLWIIAILILKDPVKIIISLYINPHKLEFDHKEREGTASSK